MLIWSPFTEQQPQVHRLLTTLDSIQISTKHMNSHYGVMLLKITAYYKTYGG